MTMVLDSDSSSFFVKCIISWRRAIILFLLLSILLLSVNFGSLFGNSSLVRLQDSDSSNIAIRVGGGIVQVGEFHAGVARTSKHKLKSLSETFGYRATSFLFTPTHELPLCSWLRPKNGDENDLDFTPDSIPIPPTLLRTELTRPS